MLYSTFLSLLIKLSSVTVMVIIIKTILGTKISAKHHCILWLIPVIQFLICMINITIPSKTSIYNYIENPLPIQASEINIIPFVWLTGTGIMILWFITASFIHFSKIRELSDCNESFSNELYLFSIDKAPIIKYDRKASTFGRFITIPENCDKLVLLHELSHYKSNDYLKIICGIFILSINWFNPVMWIAYKLFIIDIEAYCDERVLNISRNKKAYACMLANESNKSSAFEPGTAFLHHGKNELITRLKRISAFGKRNPFWIILFSSVFICISFTFLTDKMTVTVKKVERIIPPIRTEEQPTPTKEPTLAPYEQKKTNEPVKKPERPNSTKTEAYVKTTPQPSQIPTQNISVTEIEIGTSKEEIYEKAGEPQTASANGNRETYVLEDGTQAVLQYENNTLKNGYIIKN